MIRRLISGQLIFICFVYQITVGAAERVPLFFNIPPGLEDYSGKQPVTFGVPFPEGALRSEDGWRIVDSAGRERTAQFEITATWTAKGGHVRWLLIDTLAEIEKGLAAKRFLEFGPDIAKPPIPAQSPPSVTTGGDFILTDGAELRYSATPDESAFETHGPVRYELRQTGRFTATDRRSIADFTTRIQHYPGLGLQRIYHTMIWQTGAETRLGGLMFRSRARILNPTTRIGLDSRMVEQPDNTLLRQTDWNVVAGTHGAKQLDGWIELRGDKSRVFAALRWPWQQFPVSFRADTGRFEIGLIAPEKPMSLKPDELAVDYVIPEKAKWNLRLYDGDGLWSVKHNGPPALPHLSPRGVARTFELVVWDGDSDVNPRHKNILSQHPILAYADPAFATRADLPSPMSPRNAKTFPEIEDGLERAFDWITRENPFDGDYGTWNYGDVQWAWVGARGYTTYRYWMNHGKGWSIVPWALWLRSGDRRYWEHGEANSRHCMDIDMCHVPEWNRSADFKIRGGQYHYSALQMGYGPHPVTFFSDSEYLPYCFYTTGYRRAWDITQMRAEAFVRDDFKTRLAHFRDNRETRSRHLYTLLRELAVLYEATWRPELKEQLEAYLDLTLDARMDDGNFLGVTSNHYLDQPLLTTARALPKRRLEIMNALRRWNRYQGDAVQLESGRGGTGPGSMWTRHELAALDGNPEFRAANIRLARTQTLAIGNDANEWRGLAPFEAHIAGPILRDWVVAMAGDSDSKPITGLSPLLHFNSRLPLDKATGNASGRTGRHVALLLKPDAKELQIGLHFSLHNMGTRVEHDLKAFDPKGTEIDRRSFYTQKLRKPDDQQGIDIRIEARHPVGVYVLVINTVAPVCVVSSAGKVVHYLPPGLRALVSPQWGGQAWFMPEEGAEVLIGNLPGTPHERVVALDGNHRIVATSRITGTRITKGTGGPRQIPIGEPCRFKPKTAGLHSVVTAAGDWHASREIRGAKPWFAARKSEWFDPERHLMPDLTKLLEK